MPLRIQHPDEKLSLPAWREFHGWDRNGKNVRVEAQLDRETLTLSLAIDDGQTRVERRIDLTAPFDLEELLT